MTELQQILHKFDEDYNDFVELSDQWLDDPSKEGLQITMSQAKRMSRSLRSLMKALAQTRDNHTYSPGGTR